MSQKSHAQQPVIVAAFVSAVVAGVTTLGALSLAETGDNYARIIAKTNMSANPYQPVQSSEVHGVASATNRKTIALQRSIAATERRIASAKKRLDKAQLSFEKASDEARPALELAIANMENAILKMEARLRELREKLENL